MPLIFLSLPPFYHADSKSEANVVNRTKKVRFSSSTINFLETTTFEVTTEESTGVTDDEDYYFSPNSTIRPDIVVSTDFSEELNLSNLEVLFPCPASIGTKHMCQNFTYPWTAGGSVQKLLKTRINRVR